MKQFLILFLSALFLSCSSDNDEPIKEVSVKIDFSQNWDGVEIERSDLGNLEFVNKIGTKLTIDRLRYLVSDITLINGANDTIVFDAYKLIDLKDEESLKLDIPKKVSEGNYTLAMTFGFNEEDNVDGVYPDLNIASWNVPGMLGGGYHFMQMDGSYKDSLGIEQPYNFHVIRAFNKETSKAEDTSFTVSLGVVSLKNNATIKIQMNVAGWFKSPNDWNLNEKNIDLMMDYEAQNLMYENGRSSVFTLGSISQ